MANVCACLLISAEAFAFDLQWDGQFSPQQQSLGRQSLYELASRWQKLSFNTLPPERIGIRALDNRDKLKHGGKSKPGHIRINPQLTAKEWPTLFGHELAHQLWMSHCGPTQDQDEIIHEAFALWISKDSHRLLYHDQKFAYISHARQKLLSLKGRKIDSSTRAIQTALARLLVINDKQAKWDEFFQNLVPKCRTAEVVRNEFWKMIGDVDLRPNLSNTHFRLEDGFSGALLESTGESQAFPVGSILKPLAVQFLPSLRHSLPSVDHPTWYCPSPPSSMRQWGWQEALIKSCNGFFLDHKIPNREWQTWQTFWGYWNIPSPSASMAQAIGLTPGFSLNLQQVLALYEWLDLTSPAIVNVLRDTASIGTLANQPDSQWFVRNQIALKTGSVRSSQGTPIHSWIVALGPRSKEGVSQFRAVIHAEGKATVHLLPELRRRLNKRLWQNSNSARVQILGLVPSDKRKYTCPEGTLAMARSVGQRWSLLAKTDRPQPLPQDRELSCLGGPIVLHFPSSSGEALQRPYFGRLQIENESNLPSLKPSLPTSKKRLRARKGSSLILLTSEGHYAEQVIAAEFPRGHRETLKALGLGVLHNLHHSAHGDRPICDTTHCQVFSHQTNLPPHLKKKIRQSVEESLNHRHKSPIAQPWFYFSLGGSKPWQKSLDQKQIGKNLNLNGKINAIANQKDGTWQLASSQGQQLQLDCETLRNQLHLLSCPKEIRKKGSTWTFSGQGRGHGKGLNLIDADLKALAGANFQELLEPNGVK